MVPQALNTTRDVYEPIDARGGGNVNVNRFTLPKDPREILVATLLALSILVNVVMWATYRHLNQTVDLDRYDDNTFINGRFADLAAQVKADHDLIQAYGLQKAVKEK
jgi:hypothetical protein